MRSPASSVVRVGSQAPRLRARVVCAHPAASELLAFRSLIGDYEHADVLRIVHRARGALRPQDDPLRSRLPEGLRNSIRTGATSTGASASPSTTPGTSCGDTTLDTLARLKAFAKVRTRHEANIFHGDAVRLNCTGSSTPSSPRRRIRD